MVYYLKPVPQARMAHNVTKPNKLMAMNVSVLTSQTQWVLLITILILKRQWTAGMQVIGYINTFNLPTLAQLTPSVKQFLTLLYNSIL